MRNRIKQRIFLLSLLLVLLTGCVSPVEPSPKSEDNKVIIAMLDTGISTTAIQSSNLLPGWNYVTGTEDTEDRINHGTAVASVILGCESAGIEAMAADALLVALVVTDKVDGTVKGVTPEVLAQAIRDAVDKYNADIINISIGIKKDVIAVREAVEYVLARGAVVISAVGNEGESEDLYYPAAYDGVLGVGSHNKNGEISDFSQQNGTADILAPGEDIWLASRNGKTYGAKGTSYATAYVSAVLALLLTRQPKLTANEIRQMLILSARTANGWLILDSVAALEALTSNALPNNSK
mgnify:CR=1 FL=1